MEWTEITVSVAVAELETATAIAIMVAPYGLYIEDYSDIEETLPTIGWVDAIDEALLARDRETALIHFYLPTTDHPGEAVSLMDERLAAQGIEHRFSLETVKEEDWADNWKQYYKPERIGQRLVIRPTWEPYRAQPDDLVLDLDPGAAFGTGKHETTRLCLELLEQHVPPHARVLDMGCGSGILSIAALKLGAAHAVAVDIDPHAVDTAVRNAAENGFGMELFRPLAGNVLTDASLSEAIGGGYQMIVANIVADVILAMRTLFFDKLEANGKLMVSGIIEPRAPEIEQALCDTGFEIKERRVLGGWVALLLAKPLA